MLPQIKVKKVITDSGVKIVSLEEGDLEKAKLIVVEIEDLRTIVVPYTPEPYYSYSTGWVCTTGITYTTGVIFTTGMFTDNYRISYSDGTENCDVGFTTTLTSDDYEEDIRLGPSFG